MPHLARPAFAAALASVVFALIPQAASADEPTPEDLVNGLNKVFGDHKLRASHAKGYCVSGNFTPSEQGAAYSKAPLFAAPSRILGRFSLGGGNPKASDAAKGGRGLALRFTGDEGDIADFVMLSVPVFFARTPAQVLGFLEARYPGPDGKADPEKIKAFTEANPETARQSAWVAANPLPASYATTNYWGIHAFTLENAKGETATVKLKLVPKAGEVNLGDDEAKTKSPDFYKQDLTDRFASGPVAYEFIAILGEAGDPVDDPTALWPENERKTVSLGTLNIAAFENDTACDETIFAPSSLPEGIAASEQDQIFPLRTPVYAVSFSRRSD